MTRSSMTLRMAASSRAFGPSPSSWTTFTRTRPATPGSSRRRSMAIDVVKPGFATTVQDRGRDVSCLVDRDARRVDLCREWALTKCDLARHYGTFTGSQASVILRLSGVDSSLEAAVDRFVNRANIDRYRKLREARNAAERRKIMRPLA